MIEPSELLYAVGQGALAVECRYNDTFVLNLLSKLCHFKTQCRILTERSFLKTLGGGCSAPVGINTVITEIVKPTKTDFSLKVKGGVWSLDGKSEIVDEDSIEFELSCATETDAEEKNLVIDEDGVSPVKKQKFSTEKLNKSPEIIDESTCLDKSMKNASDIVNIHGKVFDVCPYSGQSRSNTNASNDKEDRRFDPLKLPIGQDFMGECPVLNIEQKISFEANAEGSGDGLGCPVNVSKPTTEDIEKCPFMQRQKEAVELIDYEANAKINPRTESKSLIENLCEVKLYCGFFCHKDDLKAAFDKCEELGVILAKKLMSAGASEIMKVAQDEIHSKC